MLKIIVANVSDASSGPNTVLVALIESCVVWGGRLVTEKNDVFPLCDIDTSRFVE